MGTSNNRYGSIRNLEKQRIEFQNRIDSKNDIEYRRHEGQFSTPFALAKEITEYAIQLIDDNYISFLEPAVGTGAFISAFLDSMEKSSKKITKILGIEKDADFYEAATTLWGNECVINNDFFKEPANASYNLLICNPPYVRHQYMSKEYKQFLKDMSIDEIGYAPSGLAGLYCYFLLHSLKWLTPNAICGWLIPCEFMDVNYGKNIRDFLLKEVTLLHIHKYGSEDSKFDDALVSSCVVWFKNTKPQTDYSIKLTCGGALSSPLYTNNVNSAFMIIEDKWNKFFSECASNNTSTTIRLGELFDVKRGLATGDNNFFIFTMDKITDNNLSMGYFKPILPSPRYLKTDEIDRDDNGYPDIDQQLFLLDCTLSEDELSNQDPALLDYLKSGEETTAQKYLCKNRKKWYFQERRNIPPLLCSYMGRGSKTGNAFRFILNHSDAIATNSYLLLYPTDYLLSKLQFDKQLIHDIWVSLNSISDDYIRQEGREYGGGLKKIEPKELENILIPINI